MPTGGSHCPGQSCPPMPPLHPVSGLVGIYMSETCWVTAPPSLHSQPRFKPRGRLGLVRGWGRVSGAPRACLYIPCSAVGSDVRRLAAVSIFPRASGGSHSVAMKRSLTGSSGYAQQARSVLTVARGRSQQGQVVVPCLPVTSRGRPIAGQPASGNPLPPPPAALWHFMALGKNP